MVTSINAQCAKCGIGVAITDIRANGHSYVMKPGQSLADLCPILIERSEATKNVIEEAACPHLDKAIEARIEQFRLEHP
jgi:hypothetical protein